MPHGLVVEGAPGTGTSTAARMIAAALLCGATAEDFLSPSPCQQRVASGNHADLHLVEGYAAE